MIKIEAPTYERAFIALLKKLSLKYDGLELETRGQRVYFDFDSDGLITAVGWTAHYIDEVEYETDF